MLIRGGEEDLHLAESGLEDNPESEFGLAVTDPALSWNWLIDRHGKRGGSLLPTGRAQWGFVEAMCAGTRSRCDRDGAQAGGSMPLR